MLKQILPAVALTVLWLTLVLPASAQGAYDMHGLFKGAQIRPTGISTLPIGLPARPATDIYVAKASSQSKSSAYASGGATGSSGNTTNKTGEGPSAALNPQYSNMTNNQRTGTLTVVSTACLAPVFGMPAVASTPDTAVATAGGAIGDALGMMVNFAAANSPAQSASYATQGNGYAASGARDGGTITQSSGGSGF